ncbi:hypothetical protein KBB96_09750 [Luteolibacter ambystomatis]|uniref:Novel STAND NTPase 1 domain-containing protein n=1 Tax=Luteolibacter ambystomatis TaxID=2824561 RepID=A0A975J374_9BACT|nr:hypothetical protein [Luteolibacter ambystomatis]QUE53164.1 hypothetical protein KBB96_09750 [Luteolibacter ambystomatis]
MITESVPAGTPWNSLAEMKGEHRRLLGNPDRSAREPATRETIRHFILQGSALGARLSSLDDRVEAQRMLDYWAAVNTGAPSEGLVRAVLDDYQDVGEEDAGKKAEELYQSATPHGKTLLKRLFLGLIELEENGTSFRLVPRTEQELTAKLEAPSGETQPKEWLQRLVATGLVLEQNGSHTLVGPSVIDQWEVAGNWMTQRRRLRGAARFWNEHGRNGAALLEPGSLLDEADGYLDLTKQEDEFVKASKSSGEVRKRKKWQFVGLVAGIGLVIALMGLAQARQESKAANKAFADAQAQLAVSEARLAEANAKLALSEKESYQAKVLGVQAVSLSQIREVNQVKVLDGLTKEFEQTIRNSTLPPEDLKAKIDEFGDKLIANGQAPQTAISGQGATAAAPATLQPGSGLLIRSDQEIASQATAGVFLRKPGGNQSYLLMPAYLLAPDKPSELYPIRSVTDQAANAPRLFSTPADPSYGANNPLELAAVPILDAAPTVEAKNTAVGGTVIHGVAQPAELPAGTSVTLIGLSTGVKEGKILEYNPTSKLIYTTKISTLGDAGAPVLTKDNKLVGILLSLDPLDPNRSVVKAAQPFLAATGFTLAGDDTPTPEPTPEERKWAGVMGEILISGDSPEFAEEAKKYVNLLQQSGIPMPVPYAQVRKRVPSKTEVRYFRTEDKPIAQDVIELIVQHGVPRERLRSSFVDDPTAPPKFIQISMAKDLLSPHPDAPVPPH